MASGLLESTGDFLESELDQSCSDLHNNTDHGEDLRYSLQCWITDGLKSMMKFNKTTGIVPTTAIANITKIARCPR